MAHLQSSPQDAR